jgi:hypothetical protein
MAYDPRDVAGTGVSTMESVGGIVNNPVPLAPLNAHYPRVSINKKPSNQIIS